MPLTKNNKPTTSHFDVSLIIITIKLSTMSGGYFLHLLQDIDEFLSPTK